MKKFSKLLESVKYSVEEIEDLFLPIIDAGAQMKIYDGYFKPGEKSSSVIGSGLDKFYTSLSKIGPNYHDAKLVIISLPIKTQSADVEPWREIQNSSGFYFQSKENFLKFRQVLNDIYACLSHIEYDYKVELEQDKIKVLLIGGLIDEQVSKLSQKNAQMFKYLYDALLELNEYFDSGSIYSAKPGKWYLEYDTQFYPSLKIACKRTTNSLYNILASLTKFNNRYNGMIERYGQNEQVVNIVKKIDDEGFEISYDADGHNDNTYKIKITPKKQ